MWPERGLSYQVLSFERFIYLMTVNATTTTWNTMGVCSRNRLEKPKADVIHYLKHFAKRSISQFTNNVPDFLWVNVSVYMFILLLLFIGPQLEYLPKIKERHLSFLVFFFCFLWTWTTVLWMRSLRLFPPRKYSGSSRRGAQIANEISSMQGVKRGRTSRYCSHSAVIMSIITSLWRRLFIITS